ncbi:MAG TPA: hypothetical protein VF173_11220 [Thermoanaerobaculia bacterium]|nr:hypothetical protein [Thermoanaerobaculia bacterium]
MRSRPWTWTVRALVDFAVGEPVALAQQDFASPGSRLDHAADRGLIDRLDRDLVDRQAGERLLVRSRLILVPGALLRAGTTGPAVAADGEGSDERREKQPIQRHCDRKSDEERFPPPGVAAPERGFIRCGHGLGNDERVLVSTLGAGGMAQDRLLESRNPVQVLQQVRDAVEVFGMTAEDRAVRSFVETVDRDLPGDGSGDLLRDGSGDRFRAARPGHEDGRSHGRQHPPPEPGAGALHRPERRLLPVATAIHPGSNLYVSPTARPAPKAPDTG